LVIKHYNSAFKLTELAISSIFLFFSLKFYSLFYNFTIFFQPNLYLLIINNFSFFSFILNFILLFLLILLLFTNKIYISNFLNIIFFRITIAINKTLLISDFCLSLFNLQSSFEIFKKLMKQVYRLTFTTL